jgi:hypothetical protein
LSNFRVISLGIFHRTIALKKWAQSFAHQHYHTSISVNICRNISPKVNYRRYLSCDYLKFSI